MALFQFLPALRPLTAAGKGILFIICKKVPAGKSFLTFPR